VSRTPPPVADRASDASGALQELLESLGAEGDALMGADIDRLAQAVQHKEQSLRRLATVLGRADRSALRETARRLRDLNERNARLLVPRMQINRARIESLLGAMRAGSLYSADGRSAAAENRPTQRGVQA
jgi:flagellar biosynthesis/type III secretory pathway chaperone